jgi:hypothetical protein
MDINYHQFILIWRKYYHLGGTKTLTLVWMKQTWLRKFTKDRREVESPGLRRMDDAENDL